MRNTRKSASSRSSTGPGKQSTLPFTHKVTKTVPKPVKDSVISSNLTKPVQPEEAKPTKSEDEVEAAPVEAAPVVATPEPEPELEPELEPEEAEPIPAKSEAEVKAEKIGNAAIERYWRNVQSQRMAKQVHQEGLTTGERLLRYFDVSSQYGVCVFSILAAFPEICSWLILTGSPSPVSRE